MNITGTAQAVPPKTPQHKPLKETWTVRDPDDFRVEDTFGSTAEMLNSGINLNGREAFHSSVVKSADEVTMKDRFKRAGKYAAVAAIPAGLVMLAAAGDPMIPRALATGLTASAEWAALGAVGLGIAGLGAAVGLVGFCQPAEDIQGNCNSFNEGQLLKDDEKVTFRRRVGEDVNLTEYQNATTPELVDGERDYGNPWWRGFRGDPV